MNGKAVQLRIKGRVQGVGYRYSALSEASRLGLAGWVRNESDGSVSVYCEGKGKDVDAFISWCRKGPPSSRVISVDEKKLPFRGAFSRFTIDY